MDAGGQGAGAGGDELPGELGQLLGHQGVGLLPLLLGQGRGDRRGLDVLRGIEEVGECGERGLLGHGVGCDPGDAGGGDRAVAGRDGQAVAGAGAVDAEEVLELVGGGGQGLVIGVEERAVGAAGRGEAVAAQGDVPHAVQGSEVVDEQPVEDLDPGGAVAGAVHARQQVVVRAEGAVGDGLGVVGDHREPGRGEGALGQLLDVEVGDVGVDADEDVVAGGAGQADQGLGDALLPEEGAGAGGVEGDLDVADVQRLGVVHAVHSEAQGFDGVGDGGRSGGAGVDGHRAGEEVERGEVEVVQVLVAEDHRVGAGHALGVHSAGRPDLELQAPGSERGREDRVEEDGGETVGNVPGLVAEEGQFQADGGCCHDELLCAVRKGAGVVRRGTADVPLRTCLRTGRAYRW